MKLKSILLVAVVTFLAVNTGCDEDGLFGKAIYNITVTNNTADLLNLFESEEGGSFSQVGEVNPGGSVKLKSFVVDKEYVLEARTDVGTVIATRTFEQDKDTNIEWIID